MISNIIPWLVPLADPPPSLGSVMSVYQDVVPVIVEGSPEQQISAPIYIRRPSVVQLHTSRDTANNGLSVIARSRTCFPIPREPGTAAALAQWLSVSTASGRYVAAAKPIALYWQLS